MNSYSVRLRLVSSNFQATVWMGLRHNLQMYCAYEHDTYSDIVYPQPQSSNPLMTWVERGREKNRIHCG